MATSAYAQQCPECNEPIAAGATEVVCPECSTVVDDAPIDHGPDWRNFDDGPDKSRARPGDPNRADKGLGSEIGHAVERSKDDERKNRWNKQAKNGDKKARNRNYATSEVHRVGVALDLPDSLLDQAKRVFRELHDAGLLLGRDMDTVCAACVYATCRMHQRGLTASEVAAVARADASLIARRHTWLCRELGLEVPPPDPVQRVRVAGAKLDVGPQDIKRAVWLCERVPDDRATRGKPSTLAAACLYQATDATQRECAAAAGVTTTAIRNRIGDVPDMTAF